MAAKQFEIRILAQSAKMNRIAKVAGLCGAGHEIESRLLICRLGSKRENTRRFEQCNGTCFCIVDDGASDLQSRAIARPQLSGGAIGFVRQRGGDPSPDERLFSGRIGILSVTLR
jgi:hypothetical protein